MKARFHSGFLPALLLAIATSLTAQTPAAPEIHSSDFGFSYSIPTDWQVVDNQQTLPAVKEQQQQNAQTEAEKKGIACVQIALTARHGDPASVILVMALPFDCFGDIITDKDLPGFAEGASEGLKSSSFDISDAVYGSYMLGAHSMWIERAKGNPKGHPEIPYTVEIACTLLKRSAACWMGMAADADALKTLEQNAVVLDGDSFPALIPANAFAKKPGV